jgi:hypothetical protein
MLTHLYRLSGAALVVTALACGNTPNDFEGADNTHSVTEANACATLRNCCLALPEDAQGMCLAGASGEEESDCSVTLRRQRADGNCL